MRILLTVLYCYCFCLMCLSQKNSDSLFFVNMRIKEIPLSYKQQNLASIPFKEIQVLDARPDTTTIGFINFSKDNPFKVVLKLGLAPTLIEFAKHSYRLDKNDSTSSLLVVVKEYRISDYAKTVGALSNNEAQWASGAIVNAELFCKVENNFHTLYKIDTIVLVSSKKEEINDLIEESFSAIFKKVINKNFTALHIGKTAFSYADIQKHINDFSDMPVLKDSFLHKGVYKNFAEFKTNNPSIQNFEVHKGRFSDELLITEGNQTYPLQNFWGYCDEEHLFIYSAKNLFKLLRSGNTFNLRGIKSLSQVYNKSAGAEVVSSYFIGIPMSALVKNNYSANPTAFQLNMQTGEIF